MHYFMKYRLQIALIGLMLASTLAASDPAQNQKPPVLVSVHGAWGGGWQFKKVASILEAKGYQVYRPTLSGLGEHCHTATTNIGLTTHIDDIVNFIVFEDLHDVILLGHSYGGMVITGVADRIPERISRLIYLDAFVPEDGENVVSFGKPDASQLDAMTQDGFLVPGWVNPALPFPRNVPQPRKTFTEPIVLKNPARATIPTSYILTVDKGRKPEDDTFYQSKERAKTRGWPAIIMEGNHFPMQTQPEATAKLLMDIRTQGLEASTKSQTPPVTPPQNPRH